MASVGEGAGQTRNDYYTLSTAWARPLAMGGAFMAVEDHLPALLYNPANFSLYRDPTVRRFTMFFNPMGFAAAVRRSEELHGHETFGKEELATALELLIRGVGYSTQAFSFAALFGEEAPLQQVSERDRWLSASHYAANQYSLLAGSAHFADRVAIGASVGLYYMDGVPGRRWKIGSSYGVTLRSSNNIRVGISYWSFPEDMRDYRAHPERIVNEAMNLGIAYSTPFGLLLSMDLRNLGEESRPPLRELHFGVEQNVVPWVALRGGFFQDRLEGHGVWNAGLALIDQNLWRSARLRTSQPDWVVQYGTSIEKQGAATVYSHALTFLIRL